MFIQLTKLDGDKLPLNPAAISAIDLDGVMIVVDNRVESTVKHTAVHCGGVRFFVQETQAEVVELVSRCYRRSEEKALELLRRAAKGELEDEGDV